MRATVTVAGLAGIAGAISYSHMRNLAAAHGKPDGRRTPSLSVDGIEIVASLVLLADRRARRPSGVAAVGRAGRRNHGEPGRQRGRSRHRLDRPGSRGLASVRAPGRNQAAVRAVPAPTR